MAGAGEVSVNGVLPEPHPLQRGTGALSGHRFGSHQVSARDASPGHTGRCGKAKGKRQKEEERVFFLLLPFSFYLLPSLAYPICFFAAATSSCRYCSESRSFCCRAAARPSSAKRSARAPCRSDSIASAALPRYFRFVGTRSIKR